LGFALSSPISFRYKHLTQSVTVTSGAASQVNFTLVEDTITGWSQKQDFSIKRNLEAIYMDGLSAVQEIKTMSQHHPEVFRYMY
jgi:hypothetical protein